ncbi:MAG: hypothetical protein AAB903_03180 [Patescibacteria group bacterium]
MDKQKLRAALLTIAIFGITIGGIELHFNPDYAIFWGSILAIGGMSAVCTILFEIIGAFESLTP